MIGYLTPGVSDKRRATELGATRDGEPGQRIPERFYGAHLRDPDGNRLAFFVFG